MGKLIDSMITSLDGYVSDPDGKFGFVDSTTLDQPSSARTRIGRTFDPEAIRRPKAESDRDLA